MTPRQKAVLYTVRDLTVDGVPPSFEEIRVSLGLSSKSEVFRCVEALTRDGHLISGKVAGGNRACRTLQVAPRHMLDGLSVDDLVSLRREINRRLKGLRN